MRNLLILFFLAVSLLAKAQTDSVVSIPEIDIGEPILYGPPANEPFISVEKMPEFKGGKDSMMRFIKRYLVYPLAARKNNVEGKVRVKFTVKPTGEIVNPTIVSKDRLGYGCEEEALAVILKMPKWKPGTQNGNEVPVYYEIHFHFKLDSDSLKSNDELIHDIIVTEVFRSVRPKPEYPGGEEAMLTFISENLLYPQIAKDNSIKGWVSIQFLVMKDGEIKDIEILDKKRLGYGCEEAAIELIKKMPKWKPATLNGIPVAVYYSLTIRFKL